MSKKENNKPKKGTLIKTSKGNINYKSTREGKSGELKRITVSTPEQSQKNLKDIDSTSTESMIESSATALLEELNNKFKITNLFPKTLFSGAFIILITLVWPLSLLIKVIIILTILMMIAFSYIHDNSNKVTEIFYEFDPETERAYYDLIKSFQTIQNCKRIWHVSSRAESKDWKRNAGASSVIIRKPIYIKNQSPPYVKTNVIVPMIPVGKQKLYFFPERVLVIDNNGIGAVSYSSLNIEISCIEFVEHSKVPFDAEIAGETWKYPNKDGGPDKRYKDNAQLPLVHYEEVHFTSDSGLNELIHLSKCNVAKYLKETIANLKRIMD